MPSLKMTVLALPGKRVRVREDPGGHMFYFAERPRADFTSDVKRFYQAIQ